MVTLAVSLSPTITREHWLSPGCHLRLTTREHWLSPLTDNEWSCSFPCARAGGGWPRRVGTQRLIPLPSGRSWPRRVDQRTQRLPPPPLPSGSACTLTVLCARPATQWRLSQHLRKVHPAEAEDKFVCPAAGCVKSFRQAAALRNYCDKNHADIGEQFFFYELKRLL